MHDDTLWIRALATLATACQYVGIDLSAGLALISACIGSVTGWAVRKTAPAIARMGWRGVRGAWRVMFPVRPVSAVCQAVLAELEGNAPLKIASGMSSRLIGSGIIVAFNGSHVPKGGLHFLVINDRDVLPLLCASERKLIERAAVVAGKRVLAEAQERDRQAVLAHLYGPAAAPQKDCLPDAPCFPVGHQWTCTSSDDETKSARVPVARPSCGR